jgi:predicted O-methyltransferase YrrM
VRESRGVDNGGAEANRLELARVVGRMTQRPSPSEELALWSQVDRYYETIMGTEDPALAAALAATKAAGLPEIQVSPLQGKLLHLLVRSVGARRILEIGTLGGYSAIWMARALPADGSLLSLELDPHHAEVARANLDRAGVGGRVEIRVGPASASLATLIARKTPAFDLVFIDADKAPYADYLEAAIRLSHRGTILVADNVVRRGDVADAGNADPQVAGVRRMNDLIARDRRLLATAIQTVGAKGYDGFSIARVETDP